MVGLGILLGHHASSAKGVSADGSVIVGSSSSDSAHEAFRWTADGGMVGLGRLRDHLHSYAQDISADGSVVVGSSGNRTLGVLYPHGWEPVEDYEAFVWTEADGMVGLGYLPGDGWSQAYAVSADGSMVVGASASLEYDGEYRWVGTREAFIWDAEHGMRSLRDLLINEYQLALPDWSLGYPAGISADGNVIVGNGGDPGVGVGGAWMVVIPEPSSGILAATGLLGLLAYTWRRIRRAT
jgi:probable HAF family extracellular repeat protein